VRVLAEITVRELASVLVTGVCFQPPTFIATHIGGQHVACESDLVYAETTTFAVPWRHLLGLDAVAPVTSGWKQSESLVLEDNVMELFATPTTTGPAIAVGISRTKNCRSLE
jgi:hypothetical protein